MTTLAAGTIRPVTAADLPPLRSLVAQLGLFAEAEVDEVLALVTDRVEGRLGPEHVVLVEEGDNGLAAVAYYAPERMTAGTQNLYLLGIHPQRQGQGHGAAMLRHVEATLAAEGARVLLVETLGTDAFAGQRAFYARCGYEAEARIRDFYDDGADKVVFRKRLRPAA